jgi:competence protein ComEC
MIRRTSLIGLSHSSVDSRSKLAEIKTILSTGKVSVDTLTDKKQFLASSVSGLGLHGSPKVLLISLILAGFLGGLGLARLRFDPKLILIVGSIAALVLSKRQKRLLIPGVMLLAMCIGCWRGQVYMQKVADLHQFASQKITVTGLADSDSVYGDRGQLEFELKDLIVNQPIAQPVVGKMLIRGFGENMVYKGDTISVSGKMYIARGSRQAGISFAEIRLIRRSDSNLHKFRRQFEAGMLSALPEPLGSLGLGLLIGQRSNLPDVVTEQLSIVGLTHIVAVSGYNLTIIMRGVKRALAKRSKYQSTVISLVLMGLFLLCTGFSASIVRAALVTTLSLWAWYYGRSIKPILNLLLVASLTAGINPLYIWSDIGWYLSFLAFFGVLVVGPEVQKLFIGNREPKLLSGIITETIAAQAMTTPLIMYIFGKFSLVAVLANILVVPLVSVAMSLSLLAGLAGLIVPAISGWLALPARWLLTYMLDIVSLLSQVSWASFSLKISLAWAIASYLIFLLLLGLMYRKNRGKYVTIDATK